MHPVGKSERDRQLDPVLRFVRTVTPAAFGFGVLHRGERFFACDFLYIVGYAVFIQKLLFLHAGFGLTPQDEQQALVDDRLPLEDLLIIRNRDVNIGKNIQVRAPADAAAGLFPVGWFRFQPANVFALFKMKIVFCLVAKTRSFPLRWCCIVPRRTTHRRPVPSCSAARSG